MLFLQEESENDRKYSIWDIDEEKVDLDSKSN